jgi:hypothetical protein
MRVGLVAVVLTGAAAVVAAIALTASSAAGSAKGAALAATGMPRYYLTVQDAAGGVTATVRDSADGRVTGTVLVAGQPSECDWTIAGAADDRNFVIDDVAGCDLPGSSVGTLYALTISPGGRPDRPVKLTIRGDDVSGMALSADGSMLAVSYLPGFQYVPGMGAGEIAIADLRTGNRDVTAGTPGPDDWPGVPAWTGGGALIVPWWHGGTDATLAGIQQFQVDRALERGPHLPWVLPRLPHQFPVPGLRLATALVTGRGDTIVGASCRATGPDVAVAQVSELSAVSGKPVRLLRTQTIRGGDVQDAVRSQCSVLSADPSGLHILIQAFTFGRLDNGTFTPLPGLTPGVGFVAAAW